MASKRAPGGFWAGLGRPLGGPWAPRPVLERFGGPFSDYSKKRARASAGARFSGSRGSKKEPKIDPKTPPKTACRSMPALRASRTPLGRLLAPLGRNLFSELQSSFQNLLSNLSVRTRTFRKSTESCPRTVREDSENQVPQRCTASSCIYSPRS